MTIINGLIRFGTRKLHTIVSKEIIKPSFPTPSHLKTYNLSVLDQSLTSTFIPMVLFYPNTGIYHSSYDKSLELKNSLSQTLTKYYPFAGRHAKFGPTYVECNDDGAEFLEATIDSTLLAGLQSSQPKDLDQFFPYGQPWKRSNSSSDTVIPLAVQVNHFECGGVGVAVSLSHKIGDVSSMMHFLCDWAKVTRVCPKTQKYDQVPIEPHFIYFEKKSLNFSVVIPDVTEDCVTKSFMFPNAKINDLKLKVAAMTTVSGEQITKPTRVEVLTWLLYKCAVAASTKNNSGSFKPTCVYHITNLRQKMIEPLPENSIGNFISGIKVRTTNESESKPDVLIGELRKQNMQIKGLKNIEAAFAPLLTTSFDVDLDEHQFENAYIFSSLCRYPIYGIDFGWGTPIKASTAGNVMKNYFIMMDAPNEEGIEVLVCLDKKDMDIIQRDPELLEFI